jgi:hypothetical protein
VPPCEIHTSRPATLIVPLRTAVLVFGATRNVTVPVPVPPAGASTVIHDGAEEVAVQLQPALAVTAIVSTIPAAPIDTLAGSTLNVHSRPAWLTMKVCPPIVIVPKRTDPPEFAASVYETVPLPE